MNLDDLLHIIVEDKGSDLYISVGTTPCIRIHGKLEPVGVEPLDQAQAEELVRQSMSAERWADFEQDREANFALFVNGIGRFRVSAFYQREQPGMVLRRVQTNIPNFDELGLPEILKDVCMSKRGLVLFVGATGAGKSTTQAAMLDYRNENSYGHILTVEDPIEYVHTHKKSIINQREVGIDTDSFEIALQNSLRQAPDVILLGEVRSAETMEFALAFAETGHLCMATLHANNANQALERILHLVPESKHRQLYFDLSVNLRGVVAQQLIPTPDGEGRCVAFEILLNTPFVAEIIRLGELHKLKDVMKKSNELGMNTFDQALYQLYNAGKITYTDAIHYSDSPNDLRLIIKLNSKDSVSSGKFDNVSIDMDDGFNFK